MKLKNIFNKFKEMDKTSVLTIRYGTQFGIGVCIIGIILYLLNKHLYIFNYQGEQYSIQIIAAGLSLLTQFIIGGFSLDIIKKRMGG